MKSENLADILKEEEDLKSNKTIEWTVLTDKKPPVGVPLIVTVYDSIRLRRELRYPVFYQQGFFDNEFSFYLYGNVENPLLPEYSKVLAWREFPNVYEGSK